MTRKCPRDISLSAFPPSLQPLSSHSCSSSVNRATCLFGIGYDAMTLWRYDAMTLWRYDAMTLWRYDAMTLWYTFPISNFETLVRFVMYNCYFSHIRHVYDCYKWNDWCLDSWFFTFHQISIKKKVNFFLIFGFISFFSYSWYLDFRLRFQPNRWSMWVNCPADSSSSLQQWVPSEDL
jgi:hypothetical protein